MTRSQRFNPIIRLADNREQQAASIMGQSLRDLELQKQRLDELSSYREDYSKRLTAAGREGVSINQMNDYRRFITKINEAITQQRRKITQSELEYEQRRMLWSSLHSQTRALDKIAGRFRDAERRQDELKEQKILDESVSQRHRLFTD